MSEEIIFQNDDLDGFEDISVRTLTYYIMTWYQLNNEHKHSLRHLYIWLITYKPTIEDIIKDNRYRSIMTYLNMFGAETDDYMGAALLEDIRISLER